ncbi:hypothetical protein IIB34_05875 [PVC group bacterium]|nr:hypothetical protein [PVC group bacterium]
MGQLSCNRCGATAEGDTQEQADVLIDHARGQMIGRPCSGKQSDLVWNGQKTEPKAETDTEPENATESDSPTKPKKSKRR